MISRFGSKSASSSLGRRRRESLMLTAGVSRATTQCHDPALRAASLLRRCVAVQMSKRRWNPTPCITRWIIWSTGRTPRMPLSFSPCNGGCCAVAKSPQCYCLLGLSTGGSEDIDDNVIVVVARETCMHSVLFLASSHAE